MNTLASSDDQQPPASGSDLPGLFEASPMAFWLEDYSELHALFGRLRGAGIQDIRPWLQQDRGRLAECAALMRILRVNRQTLQMYEADSQETLLAHLEDVLRGDMLDGFLEELDQLWRGKTDFHGLTVNYTLSGRRLDLSLKGVVLPQERLPWDRVLVSMEDVTELQNLKRQAQDSARDAREFFEQAPVSLWVEDFSAIKRLFGELRARGVSDFRTFLDVHEEFVDRCLQEIRVLDVNDYTLTMFKASTQADLLARLGDVLSDEARASFAEQLIDLWEGRLFHQKEVQNRTLQGDVLYIHLQLSVFEGCEDDWSKVLVSLTDITARKKAEAYLEYLGQHDVLTQLKNRSFFVDELGRLARKRTPMVAFIALDLNNLKRVNDESGHAAGDDLLRRFGEVLNKAVDKPGQAARIGGDEFMVLLPGMDEAAAQVVLDNIRALVELNNQYYSGVPLSVSAGLAVSRHHADLELTMKAADQAMYADKIAYYQTHERRRPAADADDWRGAQDGAERGEGA
ncbi:sensor domain-containing diguanylate cyclase [uncultured Castellaniella sp.]|uniref:sensor domain-containing diguanylate cyclase n=1 Tax=uncultured Castellaniella sp. TaxID=647907 RepID=UPI002637AAE0|nr:sensor domain-containing diguanylate cyclase [uncultured Castellaniella sp.]